MPATVRSSATYAATASEASSTVPLPSGWQVGDVVYIGCHLTAGTGSITTPSGWTGLIESLVSSSSTSSHASLLRRVMQSGDSNPAISHSSGRFSAVSVAVQDADTTTPEDGVAAAGDNNSSVAYPDNRCASVDPISTDDLLLTFHTTRNGINGATTTFTAPSGMTEINETTTAVSGISNSAVGACRLALTDGSATGTKTATMSSSSGTTTNQVGLTVVVKAAAGATALAPKPLVVSEPAVSIASCW